MDEKKIAQLMKTLGITREEAIEVIEYDKAVDKMSMKELNATMSAEEKKILRELTQVDRKKSDTPVKRERKADNDKGSLMELLQNALADSVSNLVVTNKEREMEFTYQDRKFRLTLSAPRK